VHSLPLTLRPPDSPTVTIIAVTSGRVDRATPEERLGSITGGSPLLRDIKGAGPTRVAGGMLILSVIAAIVIGP
jgi:hydroxyethylthiazole kinase-like sugar kinase family protein